jgi:hypothetical protein
MVELQAKNGPDAVWQEAVFLSRNTQKIPIIL